MEDASALGRLVQHNNNVFAQIFLDPGAPFATASPAGGTKCDKLNALTIFPRPGAGLLLVAFVSVVALVRPHPVDAAWLPPQHRFALGHAVRAMAQLADGPLWVATDRGLARFDGAEPVWLELPAALAGPLDALVARQAGGVWIGSGASPEVWLFVDGASLSVGPHQGLAGQRVTALVETVGALWIGTDAGLFFWRQGEARVEPLTNTGPVVAMAAAPGGVWIGGPAGLMRAAWPEQAKSPRVQAIWSAAPVSALASAGEEVYAWTPAQKLFRVGGSEADASRVAVVPAGESYFGVFMHPEPWEKAGQLWLAGAAAVSVLSLTTGQREHDVAAGGATVTSMLAQGASGLWLGTADGGLQWLERRAPFRVISYEKSKAIFGVAPSARGGIWAVTADGRVMKRAGAAAELYAQPKETPFAVLRSVVETAAGQVLIGSSNAGLFTVQAGSVVPWLAREEEQALIVTHDATSVWVARDHSVQRLSLTPPGRVLASYKISGVTHGLAAPDGTLWLGGEEVGLLSLAPQPGARPVPHKDLSGQRVSAVAAGAGNTLWITTLDRGLYRIGSRGGAFVSLQPEVPTLQIESVVVEHGHLWLATRVGLFRLPEETLHQRAEGRNLPLPVLALDARDGLPSSAFLGRLASMSTADTEGNLWFSSEGGLVLVPASLPAGDEVAVPRPRLERVLFNGRPLATDKGQAAPVRLPLGEGQLEVRLSTTMFAGRHRLAHRWRLLGWSNEWHLANDRPVMMLANLGPGNYRFEAVAEVQQPGDTHRSQPVALAFELIEPLHRRRAFHIALATMAAGLVILGVRLRRRRAAERALALTEQRNAIAREIHDSLAQLLTGARMQVEMAVEDSAPDEAGAGHLRKALDGINRGLEETRAAVWSLRTGAFEGTGLLDCLSRAAREADFLDRVVVQVKAPVDFPLLIHVPSPLKWHLSCIVREAVSNAVRHGKAANVVVSMARERDRLIVSVHDDGQGFSPNGQAAWVTNGHYGVAGMRERSARLRGTLEIESTPGEGTHVTVALPWPLADRKPQDKLL